MLILAMVIVFGSAVFPVKAYGWSLFSNQTKSIKAKAEKEDSNESFVKKVFEELFEDSDQVNKNQESVQAFIENKQKEYDSSKFPYQEYINSIIKNKKRMDTGLNFVDNVALYNNRLDYYDLYIKLALKEGYIVTDYEDYLKNYKNTDKKVLILRHDMDASSDGVEKMFQIEKDNGVKATYYFRWCTYDQKLINEIHAAGFEVGLHYETLATYCLKDKKTHVDQEDISACRQILKEEIKEFKKRSGIDIKTISAHGTPTNHEIGVMNNVLMDGQNYNDYGIIGETYNKNVMRYDIKSYICDNDILYKYGFSYKSNPIDSIMSGARVIEFLSHPHHWYYDINSRAKIYSIIRNDNYKQNNPALRQKIKAKGSI